jgi:hypothetical protein
MDEGAMDTTGKGLTVMGTISDDVQPLLVVPITVYVVDT